MSHTVNVGPTTGIPGYQKLSDLKQKTTHKKCKQNSAIIAIAKSQLRIADLIVSDSQSLLPFKTTLEQAAVFNDTLEPIASGAKISAPPRLCGGWEQAGYALDGCVDTALLRPPQPHSSQLGTVYATKRRRRNGKR
ncbi:unnamed protein product [Diatraea saccharalis]|uniref:Uncharacterized protein n=1 Tax=Diatraea saccharalis TaxID=40085 RepID=A0A9N9RAA6_9NEOP|nr:unnamed protein product [Diatraea saccharalis]